jgi:hypothetical protein
VLEDVDREDPEDRGVSRQGAGGCAGRQCLGRALRKRGPQQTASRAAASNRGPNRRRGGCAIGTRRPGHARGVADDAAVTRTASPAGGLAGPDPNSGAMQSACGGREARPHRTPSRGTSKQRHATCAQHWRRRSRIGQNPGVCGGGAGNRRPQRSVEPAGIEENIAERGGPGEGSTSRTFSQVDAEHDARHTPDADAAREYLSAGARGDDCAHLALRLASAVLARADVKLAFEVLAGGPFAHARTTELASLVLSGETAATGVADEGGGSGRR